jgi:hypothetical protein
VEVNPETYDRMALEIGHAVGNVHLSENYTNMYGVLLQGYDVNRRS